SPDRTPCASCGGRSAAQLARLAIPRPALPGARCFRAYDDFQSGRCACPASTGQSSADWPADKAATATRAPCRTVARHRATAMRTAARISRPCWRNYGWSLALLPFAQAWQEAFVRPEHPFPDALVFAGSPGDRDSARPPDAYARRVAGREDHALG